VKTILEFDMSNPNDVKQYNFIESIDVIIEHIKDQAAFVEKCMDDSNNSSAYLKRHKEFCKDFDLW